MAAAVVLVVAVALVIMIVVIVAVVFMIVVTVAVVLTTVVTVVLVIIIVVTIATVIDGFIMGRSGPGTVVIVRVTALVKIVNHSRCNSRP